MPLNGPGDAYSLAYIINRDFWSWVGSPGNWGGPEPRAWQNPANISVNVSALPTDEANLVKQALALWHEVANVNFSYTTGTANITYTDSGASAQTTQVTSLDAFGDRWLSSATVNVPRTWITGVGTGIANGINSSYFQTLIHETGHALGLGHSGHYDGGGSPNSHYGTTDTIWANDTWQWSIMSYNDQTQYDGGTLLAVITPQIADIYAMQATYGAASTRTGDTTYGFHSNAGPVYDFTGLGGAPSLTIYDSGGTDTLDCSGFASDQTIDLRGGGFLPGEGGFSSIGGGVHNVSIYATSVIEKAVGGSGADTIYGNDAANDIDGGAGTDIMSGGAGDDTYTVDMVSDVVIEAANSGYDYVRCYATSYTLGANVERLNYLGNPTANFTGIGNALDNRITGWNGNDYLDGGAGADTLEGFAGDDTFIVDNASDVIIETANAGYDQVLCYSTSYTLGANVEKLNYIGNNTSDFTGTGNALDNLIIGWSGNDTLDGAAGADTMQGLSGNDTYTVDNVGDVVDENANAGYDYVLCYLTSYTLGANVERLNYLGNSTANFTGYGNALDNRITGWNGNDYLDGGTGADILEGFAGNDIFVVDNAGDQVVESVNAGNDSVFASVNYTLAANVENLILQGAADLQGYGNGDANVLYGNAGNNLLNGAAGADLMVGGAGNDTYFVDNVADAAFESAGQGNDSVFASVNYGIAADVENLILQGSADFQAYGNNQANVIYGNAGNNLINAAGGVDLMVGGAGNDTYFVDDPSDSCFEVAGEGNDAVFAFCNYGLAADVETLVMQGGADLQGYGNNQANTIFGNAANNLINGAGGADIMNGGAGNDTYFVDNAGDVPFENANEGTDSVFASVGFTLTANVEALVLQGGGSISGTGNTLANSIFGNAGSNTLDGGGGADQLTGNGGNDIFVFRAGQANGDNVIDFAGNGAAAGDSLQFVGFGTTGATFTQVGVNLWQIHSGLDAHNEFITLSNGASVDTTDYIFA